MTRGELQVTPTPRISEPQHPLQCLPNYSTRIDSPSTESPRPNRAPSWCIVDETELSFAFDPPTEVGEPRPPHSQISPLYTGAWYSYSSNPESQIATDTLLWTSTMQQSVALSLQRTIMSRFSECTECTDSSIGREAFSFLRNSNATEEPLTTSLGTLYRRISHPDYSQSSTHWTSLTFDFGFGPEARFHMRVRKDIPLRWCSAVIACQLGMPVEQVKGQIALCHPTKEVQLDQDLNCKELMLQEHSIIYVQAPLS
ncbi:unnamed protein product [Dicrocoelium dendriticum]|nr:unnamed protein product [Dicrocoelium dendriticum]